MMNSGSMRALSIEAQKRVRMKVRLQEAAAREHLANCPDCQARRAATHGGMFMQMIQLPADADDTPIMPPTTNFKGH